MFLSILSAAVMNNRLILVDQSDFGTKRGWYVSLENQGPEGAPLPINSLKLILAVGDGKDWHYLVVSGMSTGEHSVEAHVESGGSRLTLDGKAVGQLSDQFLPISKPVTVGDFPDWASDPTAYELHADRYSVKVGAKSAAGKVATSKFNNFQPALKTSINLGSAGVVDTSVRVSLVAQKRVTGGLVDAYGQVVGAEIPNRVTSDDDLKTVIHDEEWVSHSWTRSSNLDPYGGSKIAPWYEKATGFYRIVNHKGVWTLVTPFGNPLFYTGLCTAPSPLWDVTPTTGRESLFAALPPKGKLWKSGVWGPAEDYFTPAGWSLERKYGSDFESKALASTKRRLSQWGFSGIGKWSEPIQGVPRIVDLSADWPKLNRHLDPFDPKQCATARASLNRQLEGVRSDHYVVGTSIGNEYDEVITVDEIRSILTGVDSAAKATLGSDTSPTGIEQARQKYAKAYYQFLYKTVKEFDPNHLYFGYWIVPDWWQNESDWDLIAPYCDVIGYDRYSATYSGMENREKRTNKPVLLGEFSYPAWYGGTRAYGRYGVFTETDAESGQKYVETVSAAARDPYCVGALWFQYRDEPVTGRGPGAGLNPVHGEHNAFGFVDINDRPKWDLVIPSRKENLKATAQKLGQ